MYVSAPASTEALWAYLANKLQEAGVVDVPAALVWPQQLHAHWKDPALLLSQACGYPLVTELQQQVQVLGAFHYNAAGCSGVMCRSALIARAGDCDGGGDGGGEGYGACELSAFRGRTVAYNSADSQSGYNALRAELAPMAHKGRFFGERRVSGSHRASVEMVRDGQADIAAIDCVSLAGLHRHAPQVMQGIQVIGYSKPYPGLPLITSSATPAASVAVLRAVLADASQDATCSTLLQDLFIVGFSPLDFDDYKVCLGMRDAAVALGYQDL